MHHNRILLILVLVLSAMGLGVAGISAQGPQPASPEAAALNLGTGFTYQGQLKNGGSAVNASCDFQFALYNAVTLGTRIGATKTVSSLVVANGLFATAIDFGSGAFTGDARFLNIQARCPAGSGAYTALAPRQSLTPSPMALALPGFYTTQNITSPNLIGGYSGNTIPASVVGGTIGGGGGSSFIFDGGSSGIHRVTANYGTVGGGQANIANGLGATIGGGIGNSANDYYATVSGGYSNTAAFSDVVGGGVYNHASDEYATVGGGRNNTASADLTTIGGGLANATNGYGATVSGGSYNGANSNHATVGGGDTNSASGDHATVGGGDTNSASDYYATVGGGYHNTAAYGAVVGGGYGNSANTSYATVPGGQYNLAAGVFSFAAGSQAKANHAGCFVWADAIYTDFNCNIDNAFYVRATGGITLFTSAGGAGASLYAGSGSWNTLSNKDFKANLAPVDNRAILARLTAMPISTWNYTTQDASIRHLGPMAQDFSAAFHVGENDTTISTVDAQGVAFAALQGLNEVVQEKDARITQLESDNAALKARVDSLDARLTALESRTSTPVAVATPLPIALAPQWLLGGGVLLLGLLSAQRLGLGRKSSQGDV